MTIITLTTDFGLQDGFVGMLKGVILGIHPAAQIVDITHAVPPQAVLSGALALQQACPFFPAGTIHLAVVDPGVGTSRRPLALRLGGWFFVGPDNGIFSLLLQDQKMEPERAEIVHLTNPRFWLPSISGTFHGRDIFAPVAAHLANGVPLGELGVPLHDPLHLAVPKPLRTEQGWQAHIIAIDVFGNLTTDLVLGADIQPGRVHVRIGTHLIRGMVQSYAMRSPGDLVALVDSSGRLEVARVNASAAQHTGAGMGDTVEVILL